MTFGIYGHICRDYIVLYLAGCAVNDFQPMLYKICINLQKRMLPPPKYQGPTSTKELYHHNTHSVEVGPWYLGGKASPF